MEWSWIRFHCKQRRVREPDRRLSMGGAPHDGSTTFGIDSVEFGNVDSFDNRPGGREQGQGLGNRDRPAARSCCLLPVAWSLVRGSDCLPPAPPAKRKRPRSAQPFSELSLYFQNSRLRELARQISLVDLAWKVRGISTKLPWCGRWGLTGKVGCRAHEIGCREPRGRRCLANAGRVSGCTWGRADDAAPVPLAR